LLEIGAELDETIRGGRSLVAVVAATVTAGVVYGAVWTVAHQLGPFAVIWAILPIVLFGPVIGALVGTALVRPFWNPSKVLAVVMGQWCGATVAYVLIMALSSMERAGGIHLSASVGRSVMLLFPWVGCVVGARWALAGTTVHAHAEKKAAARLRAKA
jgi:hypothetical protein